MRGDMTIAATVPIAKSLFLDPIDDMSSKLNPTDKVYFLRYDLAAFNDLCQKKRIPPKLAKEKTLSMQRTSQTSARSPTSSRGSVATWRAKSWNGHQGWSILESEVGLQEAPGIKKGLWFNERDVFVIWCFLLLRPFQRGLIFGVLFFCPFQGWANPRPRF